MPLRLRDGLSWCVCAGRSVFLDRARDRYFCLPDDCELAFRRWADGDPSVAPGLQRLVQSGVLESGTDRTTPPVQCEPAVRDLATGVCGSPRLLDVSAAVAAQLRASWLLRRRPVARLLARLDMERRGATADPDETVTERIASAFVCATMLLRSADQCLPRAIAARWLCDWQGVKAELVFGVRLGPFAAHSWVQADDAVVVGDLEQVRLYTPILVLP